MGVLGKLNIGIVGACGRGASFRLACEALPEAAARLGAAEAYTDYEEMLAHSELDAVIVGTPMPLHVPQSIAALEHGLHVLCEVPAGVSIEECRDLVAACARSDRVYMMAENYTYIRANVIVRAIVEQGLLGTPYYAEGEYLHNIRDLAERTTWRLKWQTGINGVTYPTHSLGPILQWMAGDRVVSVSCAGSGHHYLDPRGQPYANEDSCVMLCRLARGGLAKIRVDLISSRPHAMNAHQIQGTDGCYESARAPGERNRIWLRGRRREEDGWMDLEELAGEFLPDYWREGEAMARQTGHGGGDYFEVLDFVAAIRGERPCPIGIHEAMDMTLPGLVSQHSIQEDGRWLEVPDSRAWVGAA
jgi:predicted dehydrogenase